MNHAMKWANFWTRVCFSPDDGGSGSASSAPPSSGDGGGSSVSTPSDGGGSPTPSATPSPDSGAPAPSTPEPIEDWGALGSQEDLDSFTIPPAPPVEPVAPAPVAAPTPAPAPATPPQAPVPGTPPAPGVTPPQPSPEPQAAAPLAQLSPADPVGIATALEQNREAAIAHLAETRFKLTNEDIAELEDNAAAFVPKMMARVLHESQISMMKFLGQAVPGMLKQFNTITTANNQAEDQFFSAHKALGLDPKNPQHRATAFRMAKLYRTAHPDMPMEQLISEVGPIVAASLKLPLVPGQPGTPAQPTPGAPRPVPAFRPAVNGGGGAPPTPEPANEWDGLGREYD